MRTSFQQTHARHPHAPRSCSCSLRDRWRSSVKPCRAGPSSSFGFANGSVTVTVTRATRLKRYAKAFRAKGCFIGTSAHTTPGELSVNDDRRYRFNAVLLRLGCDSGFMHIQHLNFTRRAGDTFDEFHGWFASRASRRKYFHDSFVFQVHLPFTSTVNCTR